MTNPDLARVIISEMEALKKEGKINILDKTASLLQILGNLNDPNRVLVLRCFVESAKVICSRQNTLKKPQLKMKEIRSALELISFHYDKTSVSDVNKKPLTDLLGIDLTEDMAVDYFEKHVEGEVSDIYGRKIMINEDGLRHLYKDGDGNHTMEAQYFQLNRAKRLPWIRHTLETAKEIYKKREHAWLIYAYVKCFQVPVHTGCVSNYLMVIARKESTQAPLKFVTAYYLDNHENLLKRIEDFEPYHGQTILKSE